MEGVSEELDMQEGMCGVSDRYGAAHLQPNMGGEVVDVDAQTSEITKSIINTDSYSSDRFSVCDNELICPM